MCASRMDLVPARLNQGSPEQAIGVSAAPASRARSRLSASCRRRRLVGLNWCGSLSWRPRHLSGSEPTPGLQAQAGLRRDQQRAAGAETRGSLSWIPHRA